MRSFLASLLEVFEVALITIGAVFIIRSFIIQPFLVSGGSMEHTFENGDYLLVDQLTYRFREPERGEVVVFKNADGTYFIKRIIGLPGERVSVTDGVVSITNDEHPKGVALDELYLSSGVTTTGSADTTLGPDEYFVMGDNRPYSYDSRSWGSLKSDAIIGIARVRLWPVADIHAFAAPTYQY